MFRCAARRMYSTLPRRGDKVVIGMSGGVDSSVAARLLCDQDYDVSAVFMRNWDQRDESGSDTGCSWEKDWEDVQQVCKQLDIPCKMVDLSRQYWLRVFEPSLRQWEAGQTPNPDIWCNKEIKFGALLDYLPKDRLFSSASFFATGHYAQTSIDQAKRRTKLLQAADLRKDQSYFLSAVSEKSLSRTMFPIGHLTKPEVRELAHKHNLSTAQRPESMGVCFIGERRKFGEFMEQYIEPRPGPIVCKDTNERLGWHKGLWQHTIGQNVKLSGMPHKMFVSEKDMKSRTLYVVAGSNNAALYHRDILVDHFRWIWSDSPLKGIDSPNGAPALARFRHRMEPVPCTVRMRQDRMRITFDAPQHAIAAGQVVALYQHDWCLGSGIIHSATN